MFNRSSKTCHKEEKCLWLLIYWFSFTWPSSASSYLMLLSFVMSFIVTKAISCILYYNKYEQCLVYVNSKADNIIHFWHFYMILIRNHTWISLEITSILGSRASIRFCIKEVSFSNSPKKLLKVMSKNWSRTM